MINCRYLSLPRDKTDTLFLIVTCTFVLLPFASHSAIWISSVAGLLIAWRVWITLSGQRLPQKWLITVITILLTAAVYLHFQTWLGKEAGVSFLILLACLKMLELRTRRDGLSVIFVCYFLLIGQLMYSQNILAGMYSVLCICLLISTQIAIQYHQLTPSLLKRLSSGFGVVGLAIPLTLVLFLLFPRFQGPLWGKPQNLTGGVTGLSDSMEPGNVAELALSDQIAFRVKFFGATPPASQLYWRAIVLDTFNGKRWGSSISGMSNTINLQQQPIALTKLNSITQEIIMEPNNQRWMFGLDRPIQIENVSNNITSNLTGYLEVRSIYPIQERIRYSVISNLNSALNGKVFPSELYKSLQLPEDYNPRTVQWARQLRQQHADPTQLVTQVLFYFRQQPFRYTLKPPPLGRDHVDDFMFNTQAGFCEHYAGAFVVIMRAMGIPARVVTGYQGGEINPIDGLMTVRQADAHAWAEVWIKSIGWYRVDPTAAVSPNRIEHGFISSFPERSGLLYFNQQTWISQLASQVRLRWDAVNSAWNLWVINYNLDKQKKLLSSITGIKNPQAVQLGIAMMMVASLMAAVLSLFFLAKRTIQSPLDQLYEQFCQHMRNQGYARQPYEGSVDYGERLRPAFPNNQELVDFLSLYTKYKYGKSYNASDLNPPDNLKNLLKLCLQLVPSNTSSQ